MERWYDRLALLVSHPQLTFHFEGPTGWGGALAVRVYVTFCFSVIFMTYAFDSRRSRCMSKLILEIVMNTDGQPLQEFLFYHQKDSDMSDDLVNPVTPWAQMMR